MGSKAGRRMTFHMPSGYYDPPDPCCDDEDCDGDQCRERAERAAEDDAIDTADAERKERR